MEQVQTKGLILYNRDYREDDQLVKMITEQAGKRMFFVKHAKKSKWLASLQPLTLGNFTIKVNPNGLSYMDEVEPISTFPNLHEDLFVMSYASYLAALTDAAIPDNVPDSALFQFLEKTLEWMGKGLDAEILTNIFEVQILERFGLHLEVEECVFCHRRNLAFDYSFRYNGVLCPEHYDQDPHRSHLDPNVPYLIARFQHIAVADLESIALQADIKRKLRQFIDQLYDEYVGIQLKAKKFIDDLHKWEDLFQSREEHHENNRS